MELALTAAGVSASVGWDESVRLSRVSGEAGGEAIKLHGHGDHLSALAIDSSGRRLVTGSEDHSARIWNLANREVPPLVLRGHEGNVACVAVSPDGRWVVTGGADHSVRIWDTDISANLARARLLVGELSPAAHGQTPIAN